MHINSRLLSFHTDVWSQENLAEMQTPVALRKSSGPLGTMAYAASKAGATKTLANLRSGSPYTSGQLEGVGPFGQPLDNALVRSPPFTSSC